jgi:hypothetical protein
VTKKMIDGDCPCGNAATTTRQLPTGRVYSICAQCLQAILDIEEFLAIVAPIEEDM